MNRRVAQAGQTLISMMVGLVISLLTIGAMLAVYKTLIDVANNASGSALRDGQVSSALLTAQIEVQQAGFGIDPGSESASLEDLLAVSRQGRQVVWRYRRALGDSGTVCAGLRIEPKAEDTAGGLFWLPPQACASAAAAPDWEGVGADGPQALASGVAFFAPADREGNPLEEAGGTRLDDSAAFALEGSCSLPYAQQAGLESVSQRLALRGAGGAPLFVACLPNIVPSRIGSGAPGA